HHPRRRRPVRSVTPQSSQHIRLFEPSKEIVGAAQIPVKSRPRIQDSLRYDPAFIPGISHTGVSPGRPADRLASWPTPPPPPPTPPPPRPWGRPTPAPPPPQ